MNYELYYLLRYESNYNHYAKINNRAGYWTFNYRIHKYDELTQCNDLYKLWAKNNKLHRTRGPAMITYDKKYEAWYYDGYQHRINGPQCIHQACRMWMVNNQIHRMNGPAVIRRVDGSATWYYKNFFIHEEKKYNPRCKYRSAINKLKKIDDKLWHLQNTDLPPEDVNCVKKPLQIDELYIIG